MVAVASSGAVGGYGYSSGNYVQHAHAVHTAPVVAHAAPVVAHAAPVYAHAAPAVYAHAAPAVYAHHAAPVVAHHAPVSCKIIKFKKIRGKIWFET